ncbi:MAG TPA: CarD family transcriptional regulator [Ruania sp.]|nr:CarD family transcriptional regulator [Ruania sp.]
MRKGEVVVHPQHGPARVENVETRKIGGASRRYLTLRIFTDDMTVALPVEVAEDIGVRSVVDADGVTEVFAVLTDESEPFDKVWSRRLKQNTERLRSGNIRTIAALVRDVTRRDDEKRVSYGEASLVREGMSLLREELAAALDITAEGAEDMVLTALRERVRPEIPEPALPKAS